VKSDDVCRSGTHHPKKESQAARKGGLFFYVLSQWWSSLFIRIVLDRAIYTKAPNVHPGLWWRDNELR